MKTILCFLLISIVFCFTIPQCKDPERPLATECVPITNLNTRNGIGINISPYEAAYECTKSECKYPSEKYEECRKEEAKVDELKGIYVDTLCFSAATFGPARLRKIREDAKNKYTEAYSKFKLELSKYN